nr:hypothetical protein CFP56_44146 [Quercus suber]
MDKGQQSFKGGPKSMKSRKEVHHPLSIDWGRTVAQPTTAEEAMIGSGEGSRSDDVDLVAKKQARRDDVGNDGQSGRQAASHPGGWDNSAISPSTAETSELTHATRKVLNFEINGSEGDAPRKENLVVGFQKGHMSEEMEVISPIKPIMDFSEYKDNGYLDMGCKNKDMGPKTIGSWKRLTREKGLVKDEVVMG